MSAANPYFKSIERAPYELAHLLQDLPAGIKDRKLNVDQKHMLNAAIDHAANYNNSILSGIEAIGHLMFSAANNEQWPIEQRVLSDLGAFLSAMAVQAQYLQEFSSSADSMLARQGAAS